MASPADAEDSFKWRYMYWFPDFYYLGDSQLLVAGLC